MSAAPVLPCVGPAAAPFVPRGQDPLRVRAAALLAAALLVMGVGSPGAVHLRSPAARWQQGTQPIGVARLSLPPLEAQPHRRPPIPSARLALPPPATVRVGASSKVAPDSPSASRAAALALVACLGAVTAALQRFFQPPPSKRPKIVAMVSTSSSASPAARPSSEGVAYDARLVAEKPDFILAHLAARQGSTPEVLASVRRIGELVANKGALQTARDTSLAERKKVSAQIGQLMRQKAGVANETEQEIEALKAIVEEANAAAAAADKELETQQSECDRLFAALPNLLGDRTPYGETEEDNQVVAEWGTELRKIGEGYKWHDELALGLGGFQPDAAARVAGSRFSVLGGSVARLERALGQFMLDTHVQEHGYKEMAVPVFASRSILEGTGQLPKFEPDLFKVSHEINGQDAFLIPTAEVPLTNLFADTILEAGDLPISLCALTLCFRAEAGGYGRDTRGLIRQHQFQKVELVKITTPEDVQQQHELLTGHAEAILQKLGLPYRKVRLCSADIGFSARECYDLEVWVPGQQTYREISSCSNCGDFQARRMKLRYRPAPTPAAKGEKPKKQPNLFPCTINGSGLAVGRTLVAVLENYQEPDGSIVVPEALRRYMGGVDVLRPALKA